MGRLFPPISDTTLKHRGTTPSPGQFKIVPRKRDIHVFENGGGYYHTTESPKVLAEGAVVLEDRIWHKQIRGKLQLIQPGDVPDEIKTTMLLLGLEI
jgi:hypothetical protein